MQQIRDLELEILRKDNRIAELNDLIRDLRPDMPTEPLVAQADGEVLRVLPEADKVYINIGARDRVIVGLPFTVFSQQQGIDPTGQGKATIRVINVFETTSECRIVERSRQAPIADGDLIANIAFDPERTYSFVVAGEFDLNNDGTVDSQGAQRVRDMIREYGGQVQQDVSVRTDFVVLGEEPVPPLRPGDTAPPSEVQLYEDKMAAVERYNAIRQNAIDLQIPLLNSNRFLAFVGYQPEQQEQAAR
jgi:hypothetical protein